MPHHRDFRLLHLLLLFTLSTWLVSFEAHVSKAQPDNASITLLPMVMKNVQEETQPPESPSMINQINSYRVLAGVPIVQPHPTLMMSAQNHANYDLLNSGDPEAWAAGPHGEVTGKPGFTGESAKDRMAAAQFPYAPDAEIMNYFDDPVRSVDGWMATVFHRIGVLAPTSKYAGYGHGRNTTEYVDVVDFGRGPAAPNGPLSTIVYPADQQSDIPLYGAGETPNPLPPNAQYPIGYPITIQPIFGTVLIVSQADLRDDSGALVATYPNPSGCAHTCYALIPKASLKPATTYHVHAAGLIDSVAFSRTWSFMTTACASPGYC